MIQLLAKPIDKLGKLPARAFALIISDRLALRIAKGMFELSYEDSALDDNGQIFYEPGDLIDSQLVWYSDN